MSGGQLIGRDAESGILRRLVTTFPDAGHAAVVRGDPGVGKTALLDGLQETVTERGWRTLRAEGTPTEQRLPLAGLHTLLRPVLDRVDELPPARRQALETAFGLRDGEAEFFRVALATLDLLVRVAADGPPVVLLADDAHWLDRASADVLAFISRRLSPDPLLLVVGTRPVPDDPFGGTGFLEVPVGPLDDASAAALLDRAAPGLPDVPRRSVLEGALGNPLALLELPRTLASGVPAGSPPVLLPLTHRLEQAFAARAADLPRPTQDLLLLAALNDSTDLAEALAAVGRLSAGSSGGGTSGLESLDPAFAAGLVRVDRDGIRFRHALVRSAIAQSSTPGRRQAAHATLATVVADPDRRAWHRAFAVLGADEAVAAELEAAALRAQRRGALGEAVEGLERAAQLSGSPAARCRRLLGAAEVAAEAGRDDVARLLRTVRPLVTTVSDRLRYAAVEELSDEVMAGGTQRVDGLVELAGVASRTGDPELALRFLLRAATRCWQREPGTARQRVLAALDELDVDDRDPRRLVIEAYTAPLARGPDIADRVAGRRISAEDDPGALLLLGHAAACVGAFQEAELLCTAAAGGLRSQGRLAALPQALNLLAWAALRRSRLPVAEAAAQECVRLAVEVRQPMHGAPALAALAAIAGIRGDEVAASELSARAEQLAAASRNTIGLAVTQVARGVTAATAGRPDEAFEQLWRMSSRTGPAHHPMQAVWALGSLAEAAVHSEQEELARAELAHWAAVMVPGAPPGVDLPARYARALLAPPDRAEAAFREALAADWNDWPFEHGRVRLAFGRWLRRAQRVTDSRPHLRAARDEFERAGAFPWAEQARSELRAAGAVIGTPSVALDRLSPQERQIAQLVAEGLGNKEIGQRLYLSHRTVGSHLYRMFPKLGVSSRAQLARALSDLPPAGPEALAAPPSTG